MEAINMIRESLKTHIEWRDFFTKLGDAKFHSECITRYETAILEVEQLQAENKRLKEVIVHEQHLKALARHAQVKAQIEVKLLKEELRHAYGEDKLDDFPKADEADEALDNLKQALAAQPQGEVSE